MIKQIWAKILICCLLTLGLGAAIGLITAGAIDGWYSSLQKPRGTPPNQVFGPVWTVLYLMMGISFALIWHAPKSHPRSRAIFWFVLQFLLNLFWSPTFFSFEQILIALGLILFLLVAIVFTIRFAFSVRRMAGWLLLPYLLWVGYATYLNVGFLVLNR
ncbi:MAG: TspO/MBR family protein [Verrucomicrobiota bacterium]